MKWLNALVEAIPILVGGFVTGAFGGSVALAWVLRRHRHPATEGRATLAYIVVSTLAVLGMAVWVLILPWSR